MTFRDHFGLAGMHAKKVPKKSVLDNASGNVLIVCTDFAGAGITVNNVTDIVLTMQVNRRINANVRQTICSSGEAVNFAGRGARTCNSRAWYIGPYLGVSPSFPTSSNTSGKRRAVAVVWGTNARVSYGVATVQHLQKRGFGDAHFFCGADRTEFLDTQRDYVAKKVPMINCLWLLVPDLLSTKGEVFYLFEDSARLCADVTKESIDNACGSLPAANFAYGLFIENTTIPFWEVLDGRPCSGCSAAAPDQAAFEKELQFSASATCGPRGVYSGRPGNDGRVDGWTIGGWGWKRSGAESPTGNPSPAPIAIAPHASHARHDRSMARWISVARAKVGGHHCSPP